MKKVLVLLFLVCLASPAWAQQNRISTVPTATVASTVTVTDTTDATAFCALLESATGDLAIKTDAGCAYDATAGSLTISNITYSSALYLTGDFNQIVLDSDGGNTGTISMNALGGDRTWKFPNSSGTVILTSNGATLQNKTIDSTNSIDVGSDGQIVFNSGEVLTGNNALKFNNSTLGTEFLLSVNTTEKTGANYTLTAGDCYADAITFNSSGNQYLLIDLDSSTDYPVGCNTLFRQKGAGILYVSSVAGLTIPEGQVTFSSANNRSGAVVAFGADDWNVMAGTAP